MNLVCSLFLIEVLVAMVDDPRSFLTMLFDAAIKAADPAKALKGNLPERPRGRTVVVGAGKGVAQLAKILSLGICPRSAN